MKREQSTKCDDRKTEVLDDGTEFTQEAKCFNCLYCAKVFLNAKFLVKHIMRRHSDRILTMHKKFLEVTSRENLTASSSDVINVLKLEFADIKEDLEAVKETIKDEHKLLTDINSKICKPHCSNVTIEDFKTLKQSSPRCEISEDNFVDSNIQISAVDFQNLKSEVNKLCDQMECFATKKNMQELCSINKKDVHQQVKRELLIEFQKKLTSQHENNAILCESYFSDIKKEFTYLEAIVKNNSERINSPEYVSEMQKMLEDKVNTILTAPSLFEAKVKKDSKSQVELINKKDNFSKSVSRSNRRRKSIYTNSFPTKVTNCKTDSKHRNEYSGSIKNSDFKTFNEDDYLSTCKKVSKQQLHNAKILLTEKLKTLNIVPGTKKLHSEEYERKLQLLRTEKSELSKKYKKFSKMYKIYNFHADKLVKSKLKGKVGQRLQFSETPFKFSNSDKNGVMQISVEQNSQLIENNESRKKPFKNFHNESISFAKGDGIFVPDLQSFLEVEIHQEDGIQKNGTNNRLHNFQAFKQDVTLNIPSQKIIESTEYGERSQTVTVLHHNASFAKGDGIHIPDKYQLSNIVKEHKNEDDSSMCNNEKSFKIVQNASANNESYNSFDYNVEDLSDLSSLESDTDQTEND